jgi:hypothetical protein
MARDTDRKVISEALRVTVGSEHWNRSWDQYGDPVLTLTHDVTLDELNIQYSIHGRIVHLTHWQPTEPGSRLASRTPVYTRKRQYVLDVIGANR